MPIITGGVISTAPGASIESTGSMHLFMKCDTESSGVGLQTLEVPAFLQGYKIPSGTMGLFLEAKTQRNFWGSNLTELYPYYTSNWSDISSAGSISSGIVNSNMHIVVSGERNISKYAVMPMSIYVDATGSSSGSMSLYTLNQQVATGEMVLFTKSHELSSSIMHLAIEGGAAAVSGTMALVATGVGFSSSSAHLYVFGIPGS